jgi:lipopolysaccharide export system protein LptC
MNMKINWIILAIVLIGAVILITWLVINNLKDKKEVENKLNTPTGVEEDPELDEDN